MISPRNSSPWPLSICLLALVALAIALGAFAMYDLQNNGLKQGDLIDGVIQIAGYCLFAGVAHVIWFLASRITKK